MDENLNRGIAIFREQTMDKLEVFQSLINFAAVDGKFSQEELEFLAIRANAWNIPDDEFETALAGLSEGHIEINMPDEYEQRVVLMKEIIKLMAADGELAEQEKNLCAVASGRMDFTAEQFSQILDEVIREI